MAAANDYNGWWWNPAQSGHGVSIGQQGNVMFVAWFTYDTAGKPMWIIMGGPMTDGATFSGTFNRAHGPVGVALGTPYDPAKVTSEQVGTGTIVFSDLHHATLSWSLYGKTGTLALQRETYGATSAFGSYYGNAGARMRTVADASCGYTGPTALIEASFSLAASGTATAGGAPATLTMTSPFASTYSGTLVQSGEWLAISGGTYTTSESYGGGSFDANILDINGAAIVELSLSPSAHPGCVIHR
ncbi:MAG: hypothetical protein JSR18_05850, partial [Proteobacteria bacterium]|nr:hypothetical protein [Pseudomonadota bacterium]